MAEDGSHLISIRRPPPPTSPASAAILAEAGGHLVPSPQVKWLFSTVLQLKQARAAAYCNVPKETV